MMSEPTTNGLPVQPTDDLLWKHLKTIPAFRAILRAIEARFYQQFELTGPILDVGCGDGHFAQVTFEKPIAVGIDPWWGPLQHSARSGMYELLIQGMGHKMPFPDEQFATAMSNSVLEHIPDIQPVLNETSRVLKTNGRFFMTMPCHHFDAYLGGVNAFQRLNAPGLADWYGTFFNNICRHAHVDHPAIWAERLAQAGFVIDRWQYYFSQKATQALEIGHLQGAPSVVMRALTGHWVVAPWESSLARVDQWLRPFYEEETAVDEGAYIFIVARKVSNGPIEAALPPANPFSIAELQASEARRQHRFQKEVAETAVAPLETTLPQPPVRPFPQEAAKTAVSAPPSAARTNLISYTMLVGALLVGMLGQTLVANSEGRPGRGLFWFGLSGLMLLVAGWQQGVIRPPTLPGVRLPTLRLPSRRRWLVVPALLLGVMAQGTVAAGGTQRPFLAFLLWGVAIAVGWFAFDQATREGETAVFVPRATWLIGGGLFVGAWLLRTINLTSHPFILNGIEASLGLDALSVINGTLRSPFATGWLTNPTLPTFLLAIPVGILGPSPLSIRLLSPLIGAATVTAVFLIGQRLWDRPTGLVAAIFLAGSHFHLHYSRLGMSNIWDPLLTLLALGLVGIAWQTEPVRARRWWLAGGLAIGLCAYVYTASHLLPLMLVGVVGLALLLERPLFGQHLRHIVVAALMALIVALPQLLFYNSNPGLFMQRAEALGILAGQTNWLANEAAHMGLSEGALFRQQLWQGVTAFSGALDQSPAYRPDVPLQSFGPALFFMLGVITAVFFLRQNRYRLLLVWLIVTILFAGALLLDVPNSHRLLIAMPAVALLGATALLFYGRLLLTSLPDEVRERFSRRLVPGLALIAVLLVVGDVAFYYGRYRVDHQFADRNTEVAHRMADYLNGQEAVRTTYFLGPPSMFTDFPTIPLLSQQHVRGVNLFDVPIEEPTVSADAAELSFVILPERQQEIDGLQAQFPGGELSSVEGYFASPLFYIYEVSP